MCRLGIGFIISAPYNNLFFAENEGHYVGTSPVSFAIHSCSSCTVPVGERHFLAFRLDERNGRAEGQAKASEGGKVVNKRLIKIEILINKQLFTVGIQFWRHVSGRYHCVVP